MNAKLLIDEVCLIRIRFEPCLFAGILCSSLGCNQSPRPPEKPVAQAFLGEDIGMKTLAGNSPLLKAGVAVPAFFEDDFSTAADNQTAVELFLYAGGANGVQRDLGLFLVDGIEPSSKGMPRIRVTLKVDRSGVAVVHAKYKSTGKTKRLELGQVALKGR